eukprot:3486195-Rhodomonas_salina.1
MCNHVSGTDTCAHWSQNPGLVVLTAAVGPFSSVRCSPTFALLLHLPDASTNPVSFSRANRTVWDRAIELFYQLKGGTVDYGAKHSKHFGHDRWGRSILQTACPPEITFPGLYPEWDADHPVDFVG